MNRVVTLLCQQFLPKRLFSNLLGRLADCPWRPLKNSLCRWACKAYQIDLDQAVSSNFDDYRCFNDFFDRQLLPKARPIDADPNQLACPCDGTISELGRIQNQRMMQTKKHRLSVAELVQSESVSEYFKDGDFATIYLSPKDYHRVHIPCDASLIESRYMQGKLYAVNPSSVNSVKNLFAINERCVCLFQARGFQFALIFVGALLVSGIRLQWHGVNKPSRCFRPDNPIVFKKGAELGYFRFGSTVILLFPEGCIHQFNFNKNDFVKMGEGLACI